jgi:hypothetical protein
MKHEIDKPSRETNSMRMGIEVIRNTIDMRDLLMTLPSPHASKHKIEMTFERLDNEAGNLVVEGKLKCNRVDALDSIRVHVKVTASIGQDICESEESDVTFVRDQYSQVVCFSNIHVEEDENLPVFIIEICKLR